MKTFDIDLAKQNFNVCTKDFRRVRILCYDKHDDKKRFNIVALIDCNDKELLMSYDNNGFPENDDDELRLYMEDYYEEDYLGCMECEDLDCTTCGFNRDNKNAKTFKPYEKVVVLSDKENRIWRPTLYSYYDSYLNMHMTMNGAYNDADIESYKSSWFSLRQFVNKKY